MGVARGSRSRTTSSVGRSSRGPRCSPGPAPPLVEYQYMPEGGSEFQPYDPASPPGDVASTETDSGQTVPFIIRVEKGSMDRGIYGIAVLYDPANPVPWAQNRWDHKVVTT